MGGIGNDCLEKVIRRSKKGKRIDNGSKMDKRHMASKVNKKGDLSKYVNKVRGDNVSGNVSVCYGNQMEESIVRRINSRQWDFLENDISDKLLSVIVPLGVVDAKGRSKLMSRFEDL